jgi:hypothetical protein
MSIGFDIPPFQKLDLNKADDLTAAVALFQNGDEIDRVGVVKRMAAQDQPKNFTRYFLEALSDNSEQVVVSGLKALRQIDIAPEDVERIHACINPRPRSYAVCLNALLALCRNSNDNTGSLIAKIARYNLETEELICCFFYLSNAGHRDYDDYFLRQLENDDISSVRMFCDLVRDADTFGAQFHYPDLKERLTARLTREKAELKRPDVIRRLEKTIALVAGRIGESA